MGSSVKIELWDNVREISKVTNIPISRLIDEAFEGLIEKYKHKVISVNLEDKKD